MCLKKLSKLPTPQEFLKSQKINEDSQESLGDTFCIRLHNNGGIQYWTGTRFETYESQKIILSEAEANKELEKATKASRDIGCETEPYISPRKPKPMAEKKQPKHEKTRFEQMTMKEVMALPKKEMEEIWDEYVEALKARGNYNENGAEDFFKILDKAIKKK